jgi:anti-sigma B factor antagonist
MGRKARGNLLGSRVRRPKTTFAMNGLKTAPESLQCPVCGNRLGVPVDRDNGNTPCSRCGHSSWFRIQEFGNTVMINVLPSLDLEYSDIAQVVEFIVRRRTETHVVVNLSLVQYIGSTFLGSLILSKKKLAAADGRLILCGFNPVVEEIFRVTKLDGFFEIADEEAVVPDRE